MVAALAATVAGVVTAVLGVVHALPASAAAGDAYWFLLNDAGNVGPYDVYAQALRANGEFSGQANISWQTGQVVGNSYSISAVRLGGRLHVFAATATVATATGPRNGDLLYAMQNSNGTWPDWTRIHRQSGIISHVVAANRPWSPDNPDWRPNKLTAAAVGDDVHLLFENNGVVYHTIRYTDGNWLPFGNMSAATGLSRYDFAKLSATKFAGNGNLLVAGVHSAANDLRYTIRRANGTWDGWTSNATKPGDNVSDISDMVVTGE